MIDISKKRIGKHVEFAVAQLEFVPRYFNGGTEEKLGKRW